MADLNSTLVRGNLRVTDEITTDNLEATSITENGTALSNKYQAKGSYLPTSGGTMTGALQVNALIFGYNYTNSNNRAAFMFDKPGSNYTGIGAHAESDTIYFGACDGSGNWVDTYKQKWKFNGTIIENGTSLAEKYLGISSKAADSDLLDGHDSSYFINTSNIGSQSVNYATSAGTADDLSSSATPDIASLTANGVYTPTVGTLGNLTLEYGPTPAGQTRRGVVFKGAIESYGVTLYSPSLTGNVSVMLPNANGTLATQEWVANQGYTSNTGTVTSITIQTGTGLTGGSSTASTTTGSWTIGIDSSYKLPTTSEWNSKSSVSGVNDGTNWTSITIDGTTKTIPSMGGSYLPLSAGSTNTLTGVLYVKAATGGIGGESISSSGNIEIQPAVNGKVYIEGLTIGSAQATGNGTIKKTSGINNRTYTFPDKTGTVALTTDIKMYRHDVYVTFQNGGCSLAFSVTNTTSSSYTTLPAALKALFGSSLTAHTKTTVPVDIYFNYGTEGVFFPKCQLYDVTFSDREIRYFTIGVYNADTVDYQNAPGFYWNNSSSNIVKFTYYTNFDATSGVVVSDVTRTV